MDLISGGKKKERAQKAVATGDGEMSKMVQDGSDVAEMVVVKGPDGNLIKVPAKSKAERRKK